MITNLLLSNISSRAENQSQSQINSNSTASINSVYRSNENINYCNYATSEYPPLEIKELPESEKSCFNQSKSSPTYINSSTTSSKRACLIADYETPPQGYKYEYYFDEYGCNGEARLVPICNKEYLTVPEGENYSDPLYYKIVGSYTDQNGCVYDNYEPTFDHEPIRNTIRGKVIVLFSNNKALAVKYADYLYIAVIAMSLFLPFVFIIIFIMWQKNKISKKVFLITSISILTLMLPIFILTAPIFCLFVVFAIVILIYTKSPR